MQHSVLCYKHISGDVIRYEFVEQRETFFTTCCLDILKVGMPHAVVLQR